MSRIEPMDLDGIDSDFDNKENTFHINNVLPRAASIEKAHENLDMTEVNMKLRFSISQGSSSMSKSFTTNYIEGKNISQVEDHNIVNCNSNLTCSLNNNTLDNCDVLIKSPKSLPLQSITTGPCMDLDRNMINHASKNNVKVNIDPDDIESLSLPSTYSSIGNTPEATTPTKEIPKDGGSPIMRGLKSVLSMFRSSQSPIPAIQDREDDTMDTQEVLVQSESSETQSETVLLASTPMKNKKSKSNSPLKDSLTFKDDLERELQWKEDSAVFFKDEKVPLHILFPRITSSNVKPAISNTVQGDQNISVEYMDISLNETITSNNVKNIEQNNSNTEILESDCEFQDCETTINNLEAVKNEGSESLTAKDSKEDNNIKISGMEFMNKDVASCKTESNQSDTSLNTVLKNDVQIKVTDSDIDNIIKIDSHLSCEVMHSNIDAISGTRTQKAEIAIKSNDTVNVDTCLDTDNQGPGTGIIQNVNTELNIERVPPNIDVYNEPVKSNIAIDIDTPVGSEDLIDDEIIDNRTLEPEPQQMSFEIEPNSNAVEFEKNLDVEDVLYPETKQQIVEKSNKDAESLNVSHIITNSNNENVLDISVAKNLNTIINVNSGHTNLEITSGIELNNDNVQLNLVESSVEQVKYTEPKEIIFSPNNIEECKLNFRDEGLDFAFTNDEVSEQINQKSVLPDIVQSMDQTEVIIEGDDHDIEIMNNIICMNVDKSENLSLLHEKSFDSAIIDPLHNTIEEKNYINKIDFQRADIIQSNEDGSTVIVNTSINNQNAMKDESEANAESLNTPLKENISLTVDENVNDLSYQTQIFSQQNSLSKSEPLHEAKQINSEHNTADQSVCLQTNLLNENQKLAFECVSPKKTSSISVMKDHNPQEGSNYMEIEEAASSKEGLESSSPNKNFQAEEKGLNSRSIDNDEKLIAGDNIHAQDNLLGKNFDNITDSKTDSNILSNKEEKSQQIHCELNKFDQEDLEVENINKTQSSGSITFEKHLETKSEHLNTPPSSPKIESKGYNFDEVDDPFATKTKMRASPPTTNPVENICTQNETINIPNKRNQFLLNKRRSHPVPKKQKVICTKKMNTTCNETVLDVKENKTIDLNETQPIQSHQNTDSKFNEIFIKNDENPSNVDTQPVHEEDSQKDDNVINDKTCELNVSNDANKRNVFNLPEIDNSNFNPFATRTKVCSTPPLVNETIHKDDFEVLDSSKNNATVIVSKEDSTEGPADCNYIELSRQEDETLREVNTEDEDTIEGPFLEIEDLGETEKGDKLDDEKHDYMTFDDFPKQQTEEAENEMFIDAEAFEFLLNQNQANIVADSGKESLFLKFDPLFAKRVSSDGILAALSNFQKKQSTPKKVKQPDDSCIYTETTDVFPSCSKNIPTFDHTDESTVNNISKPTMVVNPAVVSPRKAATPPKINRQSLTFTSPAMAVIDKLLSLSGNTNTSICHDTSFAQSCSEQHHTDVALTQLREMLAEKEMHVQVLRNERKELTSRLGALESQVKTLEYESEDRLRKIKDLHNELSEKNKQNKNMATVVEEYERTIATLVAELEQDKKCHAEERMRLIRDRDEQTAHLASMEISFNDLHSKYEKSKQIILSLKANEECLKKSLQEFTDSQIKIQNNYELLKQHATAKLNHANQELEKLNKGHEAEVLKLKAMMKRKDLHISSLEETLAQKTKANEELTAICDELINKVG